MTHTLHRVKTVEGRTNDYVVLIMPARSINNQNCVEVYKKYIDLLAPVPSCEHGRHRDREPRDEYDRGTA